MSLSRRSFLARLACWLAALPALALCRPKRKARIVTVGTVLDGHAQDWTFDMRGCDYAGLFIEPGKPVLYAGYTAEELAEIARRA